MKVLMPESQQYIVPVLHQSFQLNGTTFKEEGSLESYAHFLVRTGEPHEKEVGDFLLDWLDDEPTITVQTSGSTGVPKKLKVQKQHMINSAKATGAFFKMLEGSTALLCLSANYIAGKMMLVRAIVLGWKLDIIEPKVNPLDNLFKQYDFCAMVPLQLDNSINRLHLIKKLIVGGGAIPEHLIALIQGVKTKVYETYGMTETVSHIAARRINSKKKPTSSCYFKTLPNIVLSVDSRNCLVIKAPFLCNDILTTNDIVDLKTYKKFEWKGRFDNVINSGGIKLFPEEIERKLQLIIRERFFISSLPDPKLGNKLILIIENTIGVETSASYFDKIKNLSSLSKYQMPKQIFLLDTFVETPTGKIHRKKNLEQVIDLH